LPPAAGEEDDDAMLAVEDVVRLLREGSPLRCASATCPSAVARAEGDGEGFAWAGEEPMLLLHEAGRAGRTEGTWMLICTPGSMPRPGGSNMVAGKTVVEMRRVF